MKKLANTVVVASATSASGAEAASAADDRDHQQHQEQKLQRVEERHNGKSTLMLFNLNWDFKRIMVNDRDVFR